MTPEARATKPVDVKRLKGILVDCEEHVILHRDELADLLREREELIEALEDVISLMEYWAPNDCTPRAAKERMLLHRLKRGTS